jgi:hypothetical protein
VAAARVATYRCSVPDFPAAAGLATAEERKVWAVRDVLERHSDDDPRNLRAVEELFARLETERPGTRFLVRGCSSGPIVNYAVVELELERYAS